MAYPISDYIGGYSSKPDYTQVVVDLIDGPSSKNHNRGSEVLSEDNVTGYTIRQIEDALQGQTTWNGWRNKIKNKYDNETENNLDALFNYWD
ncbi:MAG: hypothetical protein GY816_12445 [Cytophagales bacterium]|nr:hypothetical protein [Cytophagales bacterium]